MNKLSGIVDPFSNELCPDVWTKDGKLLPGIRKFLFYHIVRILGHPIDIFAKVNMIGSTLTYQYTPTSDIDLSLGLKPEYDHLMPELHEKCKNSMDEFIMPGTKHPVNLFVSPSTRLLRPESLSGGFDLLTNQWIRIPDKPDYAARHRFDMIMPFLKLQQNELKRQVDQLVKNPNKMKEGADVARFFQRIDQDRKMAYDFPTPAGGNLSTQNATFKYSLKPQNYGLIDKLYNALKARGLTFNE